jgi:arylsulfatase A-like enzyme
MKEYRNVVVLMCDHHRFDALGCLGNGLAHTPNLDRLAEQSVRFDNCFTQSPVCAPARHSLATGRYCHAHGVLTNDHRPDRALTTIAHALQPLGFRRVQAGHMHWTDPAMDTGYERWAASPRDARHTWLRTLPERIAEHSRWEAHSITRRTTGGPSPRTRDQYLGHLVATEAIRQIESAVERDERFLCWAAFPEPHPPYRPPRDIYLQFDQAQTPIPQQAPPDAPVPPDYVLELRREWAHLTEVEVRQILAGYYGMVELADAYCGMVLDALDQLGVREETIVLWTVDHGDQMWEHQLFLKFVMYEASVHVPLLIQVPGLEPRVCRELVEHVDLFPTICELVGADVPATVQGTSLGSLLANPDGEAPRGWRDAVFSHIGKLQMVRTHDYKLNVHDGEPVELFDLKRDLQEFYNLIGNPAYAEITASMLSRLTAWQHATL